jgi:hypothetical protein
VYAGWQGEMANSSSSSSSSNVVKEGDEVYKRRVRILCPKGARLVLYCMPAGRESVPCAKKKFHGTGGKLSQSPGGGMMMLDHCARLGEDGRKKDKSK